MREWLERGKGVWSSHPWRIVASRNPEGEWWYCVYNAGAFVARETCPKRAKAVAGGNG